MIARLRHDWLAWLIVAGAAISLLGLYGLLHELGQPFGGYITFQRAIYPYNEIDGNTPSWWPAMAPERAVHGDWLVAVDGRPHATAARAAYAEAIEAGSPTARLDLLRDGVPLSVEVLVQRFNLLHFFDVRLPDLISAFVMWFAAVMVYRARPDDPAHRAFAGAAALAAYGRMLFVHTLYFDDTVALLTEIILQTLLAFLGPGVYWLAISFPEPATGRLARGGLWAMLAAAIVGTACMILGRVESIPVEARVRPDFIGYLMPILLLYIGVAAIFVRLFQQLRRARGSKRDRRIAIILLIGWALALPPMLASGLAAFLPSPESGSFYFLYGLDLRYLLLFVPLAYAFVLLRYQALQAPSQSFILLMVITTSAIIAALIAWAWTLTHRNLIGGQAQPPFFFLFVATLAMGILWTSLARLQPILGRTLDWERVSSRSAREFGRRVSENIDIGRTPEVIVQAIVDEFELEQCALWVFDEGSEDLRLVAHAGNRKTALPMTVALAGAVLPGTVHPFRPTDPELAGRPWGVGTPEAEGVEAVVPLAVDNRLFGVLALGRRWDEDVLDTRSLEIFEIVGQQVTLLLAVTQQIKELQRVPGRLADAQERERMNLARELHDTTQQFLGRLPFYLAVSRDTMLTDTARATELLNYSINDVVEAANAVRQIRHNLAPSELERGLALALVTLTTDFQRRTAIATTLTCTPTLDSVTTVEMRHAIYRVVQQALTNVETHAHASLVNVQLEDREAQLWVCVTDNGCGSSDEERQKAKNRGSFGIETMTARLVAFGGNLTLRSEVGAGTVVEGWVPIRVDTATSAIPGSNGQDPLVH